MSGKPILNENRSTQSKKPKDGTKLKGVFKERNYHLVQGKFLGEGGFGICYEYIDIKSNIAYCLKAIPKSKSIGRGGQQLANEIRIQKNLNHKGVVKLYHTFKDEEYYYLLMELVNGCNLKDVFLNRGKLTEPEVRYYISQILEALSYIHQQGYIHRDFKLDNIFLTKECQVKIGDFGLSAEIAPDKKDRTTLCGTPNYLAPEILMKNGYSSEVDLWALGVITFLCLFGEKPFETTKTRKLFAMIVATDYKLPDTEEVSDQARDFIKCLLQVDPEARPNIDSLFSHSFLDKRSIPKSLDPIALTSNPGLILRIFNDENEISSKKQKNGNTVVNNRNHIRLKHPLILKFNVVDKIKEASEVIVNELRNLIETPGTVTALKSEVNRNPPKFICRLDSDRSPMPFQMYDGTLGLRYNDRLNFISKPNLPLILAYEKLKTSTTDYACSYHTYDTFKVRNPVVFKTFTDHVKALENVEGICDTSTDTHLKDYKVEHLSTATFPLRIERTEKFGICVLSDSTLQIQFVPNTTIIFESRAKRITFIRAKALYTFELQDFFISALKSGATLTDSRLERLINFTKLDTTKLPEVDKNVFKDIKVANMFYYFKEFFNIIHSYLERKAKVNCQVATNPQS